MRSPHVFPGPKEIPLYMLHQSHACPEALFWLGLRCPGMLKGVFGWIMQVVQVDKPYKGSGKKWEMPTQDDNYHRNLQDKPWRTSLKPLNIDQPEGPSFQVEPVNPS